MSQRHPFSTVSCFRRFVSRDKMNDLIILIAVICQRLYYDHWNCMNDLTWNHLKMSSLNIRTTYHIYYFTFKLYFFIIHFFVTLNIQTNFGFIVCYDIDNVHIEVNQGRIQDFKLGGTHLKKLRRAEGGAKILGYFVWKITILRQTIYFFQFYG